MDPARRTLWLKIAGIVLFAFAAAAAFSAYLRPDMVISFSDIMAFCSGLIR